MISPARVKSVGIGPNSPRLSVFSRSTPSTRSRCPHPSIAKIHTHIHRSTVWGTAAQRCQLPSPGRSYRATRAHPSVTDRRNSRYSLSVAICTIYYRSYRRHADRAFLLWQPQPAGNTFPQWHVNAVGVESRTNLPVLSLQLFIFGWHCFVCELSLMCELAN